VSLSQNAKGRVLMMEVESGQRSPVGVHDYSSDASFVSTCRPSLVLVLTV
jgi:hypothetical protein